MITEDDLFFNAYLNSLEEWKDVYIRLANYTEELKRCSNHPTFKDWFEENLSEYAPNITEHGASSGYPYI